MFKVTKSQQPGARPISMSLIDFRAAFVPCAVLSSFVAALVGLMMVVDVATKQLVI